MNLFSILMDDHLWRANIMSNLEPMYQTEQTLINKEKKS